MERKDIVIIGTSGFAREVLWQLKEADACVDRYNVLGFVDDTPPPKNSETLIDGYSVLGTTAWLAAVAQPLCVVIAIGKPAVRKMIYGRLKDNPNITFPTIISNDVHFSESVKFGQGCFIGLKSILTVHITLGDFVIVNGTCSIGHGATIGDFATVFSHSFVSGEVCISDCAEIGAGTSIIPGKVIGENAIIGAGSVVTRDIPANCTAVGSPAKPVKFHN